MRKDKADADEKQEAGRDQPRENIPTARKSCPLRHKAECFEVPCEVENDHADDRCSPCNIDPDDSRADVLAGSHRQAGTA